MQGTLTFLGTGTSMGVPSLGCECAVCCSADPHDKRTRPSIALRWPCPDPATQAAKPAVPKGFLPFPKPEACERVVLIDTGPDFRAQALQAGIKRVDAAFYTHSHADHILGLDDLRPLSFGTFRQIGPVPLYATQQTRSVIESIYSYTFDPDSKYPTRAKVALHTIEPGVPAGVPARDPEVQVLPIPVFHGEMPIVGYRIGKAAYLTDVSTIPEASFDLLEGLDTLILSALRHKPHPSHATVDQAVRWANRIDAKSTWFTHISHDLGHEQTNANLPEGMALAYDGLVVPVELA